ncbi:MAG: hypothetical protein L3J31_03165 [Bacteroidales bacterium]|nr:hypothetical protein [Bacteroidales bacterium]MCF6341789.1 hypothetical protein [Bacteroidales bacterium]
MKTFKKITGLLILILFLSPLAQLMAQGPPPPPGGSGTGDEPIGGNAPIGSGLIILTALGIVYGGKKLYDLRKEAIEE